MTAEFVSPTGASLFLLKTGKDIRVTLTDTVKMILGEEGDFKTVRLFGYPDGFSVLNPHYDKPIKEFKPGDSPLPIEGGILIFPRDVNGK